MVNKYCVGESRWNKEKVALAKLTSHLVSSFLSQIEKGNLDPNRSVLDRVHLPKQLYMFKEIHVVSRQSHWKKLLLAQQEKQVHC